MRDFSFRFHFHVDIKHLFTPPPSPLPLRSVMLCYVSAFIRFTSGNPNAALPAPATAFGGVESAQAAAQAAVAALGVVSLARPTCTLRLNNMLTAGDLEDEDGLGGIEEETKVCLFHLLHTCLVLVLYN